MKMIAILSVILMTGCASAPKPAPGTAPGDMSPEGHMAAAEEHEHAADVHEAEADQAQKVPQKGAHKQEAAKEQDIAQQHEEAAEAAGSGESQ